LQCPQCKEEGEIVSLSHEVVTDKRGKINIIISCEECLFAFRIKTDIKAKDLKKFANLKRLHKIEASIGYVPLKWQHLI